jgi:hypothetical protein
MKSPLGLDFTLFFKREWGDMAGCLNLIKFRSMTPGNPIVRYDCSHGFLHRDVMLPGGKKEKYPLDIPDLKTALLYAEQDIKDRWKWYRDRYRRRLRR